MLVLTFHWLNFFSVQSGQTKEVLQFHYTTWPDFGVPESPAAFLAFLLAVRRAGVLGPTVGPAVIHCSAGIGRSGTFCLVDTCLVLVSKYHVDVRLHAVTGCMFMPLSLMVHKNPSFLMSANDKTQFYWPAEARGSPVASLPRVWCKKKKCGCAHR